MKADHDAARRVATKALRARPIKIGPRAAWAQGCGLFPIPGADARVASRREWQRRGCSPMQRNSTTIHTAKNNTIAPWQKS